MLPAYPNFQSHAREIYFENTILDADNAAQYRAQQAMAKQAQVEKERLARERQAAEAQQKAVQREKEKEAAYRAQIRAGADKKQRRVDYLWHPRNAQLSGRFILLFDDIVLIRLSRRVGSSGICHFSIYDLPEEEQNEHCGLAEDNRRVSGKPQNGNSSSMRNGLQLNGENKKEQLQKRKRRNSVRQLKMP